MAQAVRRSPPIAGVPSSRPGHSMWVSRWTKRDLNRFFRDFPVLFYHKFHSTISPYVSYISFYFISSSPVMMRQACVVDWYSCHSLTLNIGLHRISSLDSAARHTLNSHCTMTYLNAQSHPSPSLF